MIRFHSRTGSSRGRGRKRPPLILGLIFFLIGLVVTSFGIRTVLRAGQSESWPTAEGVVKVSELDRKRDRDGTTYHADILYEYTVNGELYSCNRVSYGEYGSSNSSHARGVCNRYPVGKPVVVYYDPGDPEEAVLEAGRTWSTYMMAGIGAIFALVGGAITVAWRKGSPASEPSEEAPPSDPSDAPTPQADTMPISTDDDNNPYRSGE